MERELQFKEILSVLSEQQLSVYLLRQDGMSPRQIGEELDISESTVRKNLHRAEQKLEEYKAYLQEVEFDEEKVDFPLTYRELKLFEQGLRLLEEKVTQEAIESCMHTWGGKDAVFRDQLRQIGMLLTRAEIHTLYRTP